MSHHCEHVKSNGHFCQSPAIRGRNYCFFHLNHLGRKLRAEKHAAQGHFLFELPLLEDAAAIQVALMQVTNALLHGQLDPKRAGLILYALQTASINLRNVAKEAKDEETAPVCNQYDSFEADYDIEDHAAELRVVETSHPSVPDSYDREPDEETLAALRAADAPGSPYANNDEVHWLIDCGVANGYLEPMYPAGPPETPEAESAAVPGDELPSFDTTGTPDTDASQQAIPTLHQSEATLAAPPQLRFAQPASARPKLRDPDIDVPYQLTHIQYQQAKASIAEYEKANRLVVDTSRKPVLQHAAISQSPLLGLRKPPKPFDWPFDSAEADNAESVSNGG